MPYRRMSSVNRHGNKVHLDGYVFDSQKEANFYSRYVKNSGYGFAVHPNYLLLDKIPVQNVFINGINYKPDFVIYSNNKIRHVYDVKNGMSNYDIDSSVQLRFKMFADRYGIPVEVVVPRVNFFWTKILGTSNHVDKAKALNINYSIQDLLNLK